MSATILEQPTQKMSLIFPTEPSKTVVHPLPKKAERITYSVADTLWIKAWMSDGLYNIQQESDVSHDDFYHEHCDSCHRNCYDFLTEYEDEDGEIDWDTPELRNHCNVYDNGYSGQPCPEGNVLEPEEVDFELGPIVFGINLNHLNTRYPKFDKEGDTAYLCAGYEDADGNFHSTEKYLPANVYGNSDYPGNICWGNNDRPQYLSGIVESYFKTPFNSDLVPLKEFERASSEISFLSEDLTNFNENEEDKVLCNFSPDSLMLIDASSHAPAFFQMLTAGFKSLPEAPHIMMIPLFQSEVVKNGHTYSGYLTVKDDLDKQWFVTHDGLIVGQI